MNHVYSKDDRRAFVIVFGVSLFAYFQTLSPTVSLEYSGALTTGAVYFGVPYPPGYPVWTVVNWFFQLVFHWVRYFGTPDSSWSIVGKSILHAFGIYDGRSFPNPAFACALCSACFGAMTSELVALLVSNALRSDLIESKSPRWIRPSFVSAVCAGLLLGFSRTFWSQSVIVEAFTMNTATQMLCLTLLWRWIRQPEERWALWIAFWIFGLGLTNHPALWFMLPVMIAGVALANRRAGLVLAASIAAQAAILFFVMSVLPRVSAGHEMIQDFNWWRGPRSPAFWLWTILFVSPPIFARNLPGGILAGRIVLCLYGGFLFFFFQVFASEQNPPINWSHTRTFAGVMHSLTVGQREGMTVVDFFSRRYLDELQTYFAMISRQFTMPITLLALLGLLQRGVPKFTLLASAAFLTTGPLTVAWLNLDIDVQTQLVARVHMIPNLPICAIFIGLGIAKVLQVVAARP